jgi:hypothetical protein
MSFCWDVGTDCCVNDGKEGRKDPSDEMEPFHDRILSEECDHKDSVKVETLTKHPEII